MWERNQKVKKIIKDISLLTFKDERVVQQIAYHPLLFFKQVMEDDYDERAVRIKYFGVFSRISKLTKEEVLKEKFDRLLKYIENVYEACKLLYPDFKNHIEFKEFLLGLYDSKDWGSISFIRKKYREWKRKNQVTNVQYLKP